MRAGFISFETGWGLFHGNAGKANSLTTSDGRDPRIRGIRLLVAVSLILAAFGLGGPAPAQACSPAPVTFAQTSESAVAAVQGVVTQVTKDGRQATIDVKAYAGPDKAPQTVMLPSTVDSKESDDCPDQSTKFKVGEAYVVLLAEVAPVVKLASPKGITAFPVQGEQLTVGFPQGEQAPLAQQMERFAETKKTAVQYPTRSSPVWYSSGNYGTRQTFMAGIALLVVAGGVIFWLRSRRKK